MPTTLFIMPIKADKTEAYKTFINDCVTTKRKEYQDLLLRYDLNDIKMWIHTLGDKDYAIFTHEMGDNATERLATWSSSTHPFDQWFNQQLTDCYATDNADNLAAQPTFFAALDARTSK